VERILQREEAVLLRSRPGLLPACVHKPSQLHRTVNGLRTAIREEDAIETGPSGEFAGERALARVVIEIRKMNRAGRFAADYFHDAGMRVTEGVDGDATEKIEIPLPGGVKNISAAPCVMTTAAVCKWQEKLFGIQQTRVLLDGLHPEALDLKAARETVFFL